MPGGNRDLATLADIIEPADRDVDGTTAARARAVVAAHARDREDLQLLLEALGLGEPARLAPWAARCDDHGKPSSPPGATPPARCGGPGPTGEDADP